VRKTEKDRKRQKKTEKDRKRQKRTKRGRYRYVVVRKTGKETDLVVVQKEKEAPRHADKVTRHVHSS